MENIENIIKSRHSVRSFTDKTIVNSVVKELNKTIKECNEKSGLNIKLVLDESNVFGKSHYGNFNNCKNYIVIIGNKNDSQLDEKAGYYGEVVVLKAQSLGLNSCWVGLTYKKSEVPCELEEKEIRSRPFNMNELKAVMKALSASYKFLPSSVNLTPFFSIKDLKS